MIWSVRDGRRWGGRHEARVERRFRRRGPIDARSELRALAERLHELGWREQQITVIDEDQGVSAAYASGREGFQKLVADVGLRKIGIITYAVRPFLLSGLEMGIVVVSRLRKDACLHDLPGEPDPHQRG